MESAPSESLSEHSPPPPDSSEGKDPLPEEPKPDPKQCRICLAGEEECDELGRLIKPCLCKGSIRYVHVKCINEWRTSSASRAAFWSCPQCGFKYSLARTRVVGLATSPIILGSVTLTLFTIIVFLSSFVVSLALPELTSPSASPFIPIDDYSYSFSPLSVAGDVIRLAVRTFAEADPLNANANHAIPLQGTGEKVVYVDQNGFRRTVRIEKKSPTKPEREQEPKPPTLLARLVNRFFIGLSFVGILSFLNLLVSMSLLGPIQMARGRWWRGHREGNGRGGGANAATVLIVVFVVIGVLRAIYGVYQLTQRASKKLLVRAETAILEVGGDDDEEDKPHPNAASNTRVDNQNDEAERGWNWARQAPPGVFVGDW